MPGGRSTPFPATPCGGEDNGAGRTAGRAQLESMAVVRTDLPFIDLVVGVDLDQVLARLAAVAVMDRGWVELVAHVVLKELQRDRERAGVDDDLSEDRLEVELVDHTVGELRSVEREDRSSGVR